MGGYRGTGGELCQCGTPLDPDRANTRNQHVNRHVGHALLLSFAHFQNAQRALPAIAAYALAAPLMMVVHAKWMRRSHQQLT
jgi:phytoene/squalene synthetase